MIIFFDGGCRPNPGMMEVCVVAIFDDGTHQIEHLPELGYGTNNISEWCALTLAIDLCKVNDWQPEMIYGDSNNTINQAKGNWQVKDKTLKGLYENFVKETQNMIINLEFIPRADNLAGRWLEKGNF
jgi:ribonuclease HI